MSGPPWKASETVPLPSALHDAAAFCSEPKSLATAAQQIQLRSQLSRIGAAASRTAPARKSAIYRRALALRAHQARIVESRHVASTDLVGTIEARSH